MSKNSNGEFTVGVVNRGRQESMALFDSFSPEIRAILRDAHYNISIKPGHEKVFKDSRVLEHTLMRVAKESALKTYGKNYPLETIK
jgi:hypothetical protein